jgi:hypothetical protein
MSVAINCIGIVSPVSKITNPTSSHKKVIIMLAGQNNFAVLGHFQISVNCSTAIPLVNELVIQFQQSFFDQLVFSFGFHGSLLFLCIQLS